MQQQLTSVLFIEWYNTGINGVNVTARDSKRVMQSETFQAKSRKRINDKCHREEMERLTGIKLDGWETAEGKRTKSIDEVSMEKRMTPRLMMVGWMEYMLYLQAH